MKNNNLGLIYVFDKKDVVNTECIIKNKSINNKIVLIESRNKCNPNVVRLNLTLI